MTKSFRETEIMRKRRLRAGDPDASVWVSANAGSGKTHVLTQRVLRLLLAGVAPERLLCLTYTKAAAAEMRDRVGARLSAWALMEGKALDTDLRDLADVAPDHAMRARARTLFARALDTPGGRAFAPTVLTNARDDLRVVADEVFGPVVVVEPYDDVEHAFDAVNRGRFGLQAGIFTNDLGVARRAFERLEVGAVLVNEVPTWRADHMPYGGNRQSGLGREGVKFAMEDMTNIQLVAIKLG